MGYTTPVGPRRDCTREACDSAETRSARDCSTCLCLSNRCFWRRRMSVVRSLRKSDREKTHELNDGSKVQRTHGKPTGRRPARSRTKVKKGNVPRGEKRQQGQSPRVPGRKQVRDTDLVSKATGRRRPTRSRKATSSFSQARGHPHTKLDENSDDDETIITSKDNLQKRLQNGEAQGRPQRRCTTCSSQRTIAAVRSKKEHDQTRDVGAQSHE